MKYDIRELARDELEADEPNLLDYLSDGEGDDFDQLEAPIKMDRSFPTTVMVCGLPAIPREKETKLMDILKKFLDRPGPNSKYMPFNDKENKSYGFLFATYESAEIAQKAYETIDKMALDKKHIFKVVKLDTFDEVISRPDQFSAKRTLVAHPRNDFRWWLQDKRCWEQLLVRYQNETEIHWFDSMNNAPLLSYGGEREKKSGLIWCDWKVEWSPLGSYIATHHKQGIALWAGPNFEKRQRIAHAKAQYSQFSPTEEYLLTWDGSPPTEQKDDAVKIFRVLTGEMVRKHKTPYMPPTPGADFPIFAWSYDGKYYAECTESSLTIRNTSTFEIIKDADDKKKAWKFEKLVTFQWSPKDNVIAVWTAEQENVPARLSLLEVPSKKELKSATRTQVEASVHWQSQGDYLCLLSTKLSKQKKKGVTNMEIFRMRERDIPVDIAEVKDSVKGFFWETKGSRFGVLTADEAGQKPKLLIYQLGKETCDQIVSLDLPSNSFNNMFWAPEGQYFVIAGIGQGDLMFGGITPDNKLEILFKDEHYMVTNVEWDPSSRYVLTSVQQPMRNDDLGSFKYSMEAGYAVWTFQGRRLYQHQKEKLHKVAWRPHPPSLLSAKQGDEIRRNIKQFSKKYDAIDENAREQARYQYRIEREQKTNSFRDVLNRLQDFKDEGYESWDEAVREFRDECGWEMTEETHEEEIDVSEELIS